MRVVLSGQERIMNAVKTDVIIPAYHPGEEFDKLLERLSAQKYPVNKIIVMNTEKILERKLGTEVSAGGSPPSYKTGI